MAVLFTITGSLPLPNSLAYTPAPSAGSLQPRELLDHLTSVKLPQETGEIAEYYKGTNDRVVVLIQDAHAIADAQRSIQQLIDFFQKDYGVHLVALEGAASSLDPTLFKSFPDKKLLQKVFQKYYQSGELTGGTAAAIFNESKGLYHGVENWKLYEEGIGYFLDALQSEPEVVRKINGFAEQINAEKKKLYSGKLLEIDKLLRDFEGNSANFMEVLEKLSSYCPPPEESELALIVHEAKAKPSNEAIDSEVRRIAREINNDLSSRVPQQDFKDALKRLNSEIQQYQTSQITPEAFALSLKDIVIKHKIRIKVSKNLNALVKNQRRIRDIRGTDLFRSFEEYVRQVIEPLLETPAQRSLHSQSEFLDLMMRLAKLELTQEDWRRLLEIGKELDHWSVIQDGVLTQPGAVQLIQKMKANMDFYASADKRDHEFYRKITDLMNNNRSNAAIVVAGGFHTEGLTQQLRSKGTSYILLMPKILQLPEDNRYEDQMRGEVSWSSYFEIEDGKVSLYKAFVRGARDELLNVAGADAPKLKKLWRDQIIRDLAAQNRLSEASQYTRFIDETNGKNVTSNDSLKAQWLANIDRFADRLTDLQTKGQFTEGNVLKTIQFMTSVPIVTANGLEPKARVELRSLPFLNAARIAQAVETKLVPEAPAGTARKTAARSELRVDVAAWQAEYAQRNNWTAPTEITYWHRKSGIASREKYPQIYGLLDRIAVSTAMAADKIWPEANLQPAQTKVFLTDSDTFELSYSAKTNFIYISLGALRFLKEYGSAFREEDVAFLIAFEMGRYVQKQLGLAPKKDSDKKHADYDADNRAVQILNRAGYSVKRIERIFDYFEKYEELKKAAPQISREQRAETARNLLEALTQKNMTPENIARSLIRDRSSFMSLMQEAFRNTPPVNAIRGEIKENGGWGGSIFMFPQQQLDHLRNAHDRERLFDDYDTSIEGISALNNNDFVRVLSAGKNQRILQVVLEAYLKNLETSRKSIEIDIPYLKEHPHNKERKLQVRRYRKGNFWGSFDKPLTDLNTLDEELRQTSDSQEKINAIVRLNGLDEGPAFEVIRGYLEKTAEWQEAVFFAASLDAPFHTDRLYNYFMERAAALEKSDEKGAILLRHQVNVLYRNKEANNDSRLETDLHFFFENFPYFGSNGRGQRKGALSLVEQQAEKNLDSFATYHSSMMGGIANQLASAAGLQSYSEEYRKAILPEKLVPWFDIFLNLKARLEFYIRRGINGLPGFNQDQFNMITTNFPMLEFLFKPEWLEIMSREQQDLIIDYTFTAHAVNSDNTWKSNVFYPVLLKRYGSAAEFMDDAQRKGWDLSHIGIWIFTKFEGNTWAQDLELLKVYPTLSYGLDSEIRAILSKHYPASGSPAEQLIFLSAFLAKVKEIAQERGLKEVYLHSVIGLLGVQVRKLVGELENAGLERIPSEIGYENGITHYTKGQLYGYQHALDDGIYEWIEITDRDGNTFEVSKIENIEFGNNSLIGGAKLRLRNGQEKGIANGNIASVMTVLRQALVYPDNIPFLHELKQRLKDGFFRSAADKLDQLTSPYSMTLLFFVSQGFLIEKDSLMSNWFFNHTTEELSVLFDILKNHVPQDFIDEKSLREIRDPTIKGVRYASSFIDTYDQYLMFLFNLIRERRRGKVDLEEKQAFVGETGEGKTPDGFYLSNPLTNLAKEEERNSDLPLWRRRSAPRNQDPNTFAGKSMTDSKAGAVTTKMMQEKEIEFIEFLTAQGYLKAPKSQTFGWSTKTSPWDGLGWDEMLTLVERHIPPSVFRNYLLYYLYAKKILSSHMKFDMDRVFEFEEFSAGFAKLPPATRQSLQKQFAQWAPLLILDEYIQTLNLNAIEARAVKWRTQGRKNNPLFFDGFLQKKYAQVQPQLQPNAFYAELGGQLPYLDLMLAGLFSADFEKESLRNAETPVEQKLSELERLYPRLSNTRDYYLNVLLEVHAGKLSADILQRIGRLAATNPLQDRVHLEALTAEIQLLQGKSQRTFESELALILKYYPDASYFRDDLLVNLEQSGLVNDDESIHQLRGLYTFDFERFTEEGVKKQTEAEDNLFLALDLVDVKEKQALLLWLGHLTDEKPGFLKKMELLFFTKFDSLREQPVYSTAAYEGIGLTARRKLIEDVLRRGDASILEAKQTVAFVDQLLTSILTEFNVSLGSPKNQASVKIIRNAMSGLFKRLADDPGRTVKVLSDLLIRLEALKSDKELRGYSDQKKLALVSKTLLKSTGVIGVKLGQYLSVSTSMGLGSEFKSVLRALTEESDGADKRMILSVLHELREEIENDETLKAKVGGAFKVEDIRIKKILKSASIKTTFTVEIVVGGKTVELDEVWKVKNTGAIYDAETDLEILDGVTDDLVSARLMTLEQKNEVVKELRRTLEEELDLNFELENTSTMRRNAETRPERPLSADAQILHGLLSMYAGDLSSYKLGYTNIFDVKRNVLIREQRIRGKSLTNFIADPEKSEAVAKIKKALVLELFRQIFQDGFYHADLHPGNVLIHENGDGTYEVTVIDMGGVSRIGDEEKTALLQLFAKMIRWKAMKFIDPEAKLDVTDELKRLSFQTQRFLDKISYLFDEESLLPVSTDKAEEQEIQGAADMPEERAPEDLTGMETILDVFPALKNVRHSETGQSHSIENLVGHKLRVQSSWKVLGEPEPGKDFTGVLRSVTVSSVESYNGGQMLTLRLTFNDLSNFTPKMSYLERLGEHTIEIRVALSAGGEKAEGLSNVIVTDIELLDKVGPEQTKQRSSPAAGAGKVSEKMDAPSEKTAEPPQAASVSLRVTKPDVEKLASVAETLSDLYAQFGGVMGFFISEDAGHVIAEELPAAAEALRTSADAEAYENGLTLAVTEREMDIYRKITELQADLFEFARSAKDDSLGALFGRFHEIKRFAARLSFLREQEERDAVMSLMQKILQGAGIEDVKKQARVQVNKSAEVQSLLTRRLAGHTDVLQEIKGVIAAHEIQFIEGRPADQPLSAADRRVIDHEVIEQLDFFANDDGSFELGPVTVYFHPGLRGSDYMESRIYFQLIHEFVEIGITKELVAQHGFSPADIGRTRDVDYNDLRVWLSLAEQADKYDFTRDESTAIAKELLRHIAQVMVNQSAVFGTLGNKPALTQPLAKVLKNFSSVMNRGKSVTGKNVLHDLLSATVAKFDAKAGPAGGLTENEKEFLLTLIEQFMHESSGTPQAVMDTEKILKAIDEFKSIDEQIRGRIAADLMQLGAHASNPLVLGAVLRLHDVQETLLEPEILQDASRRMRSELRSQQEVSLGAASTLIPDSIIDDIRSIVTLDRTTTPKQAAKTIFVMSAYGSDANLARTQLHQAVEIAFLDARDAQPLFVANDIFADNEAAQVLEREMQALIQSVELIRDSNLTVGIVLPDRYDEVGGNAALLEFKQILDVSNGRVTEILFSGELPVAERINFQAKGAYARAFSTHQSITTLNDLAAVPLAVMKELHAAVDAAYVPIQSDLTSKEDPLVVNYVELMKSVAVLHLADIIKGNPLLLKDPALLKATLLGRLLRLDEKFSSIIENNASGLGFTVKGAVARAYLAMRVAEATAQAA